MSSARNHHQLSLPPTHLKNLGVGELDHKRVVDETISEGNRIVGALIDEARAAAGITRKEACALMLIDEARWSKWVSGAANDTPSLARLWLLPPTFWFQFFKLTSARKGLRRMAVADLLGAAADVALLAEAR